MPSPPGLEAARMDGSTRRAEAWLTGREPTMAGRRRGQIIQAPNSKTTWTIRISLPADVEGKRKTWNKTVHGTRKDAERALTRALSDLDQGRLEDPSRMPLADWLDEWMESKRQDLRERTWLHYQNIIRLYLVPLLGKIRLADLKPRDVQKAITALGNGEGEDRPPLSPASIRYAVGRLRQALAVAVRLRLVPSNAALDASLPRARRPGPGRVLSPEEVPKVAAALWGHRLGALWLLMIGTGLRPGEALGLLWEDVDLPGKVLKVRRSLWRPSGRKPVLTDPKTESSAREVPLSSDLVAILKAHKARQNADRLAAGRLWEGQGLVFCSQLGKPLGYYMTVTLNRILKAAGIPRITMHGLRHSAATLLIDAGIDARTVADRLGHANVATTLAYYKKTSPERQKEASDLLTSMLFGRQAERGG